MLLLLGSCLSENKNVQKHSKKKENVFPLRDDVRGGNFPFPESHTSTLIKLDNGQFLVAWFSGTKEKNDDVGIWISKGKPDHWTFPKEIAKMREDAYWNPVLFKSPGGEIKLYFR